jgi:hypothetical protein
MHKCSQTGMEKAVFSEYRSSSDLASVLGMARARGVRIMPRNLTTHGLLMRRETVCYFIGF